ncbi:MAG: DNA/RNA nuclease SfsA [Lachnospiraceae bacterium]|nr:DNA/RNA nuclease SfsA [Lachnospiraceae bacterium]
MKYKKIVKAKFIERPNRFIAYANLNGQIVKCHVKNTGRCKELLVPGAEIFLEDHSGRSDRKTQYSLVKVVKEGRLINMDSQAPNQVAYEWIQNGGLYPDITLLKREQKYGNSRFDLYYERKNGEKGFVEVKGVTLEINNIAKFPDAPTGRGVKHIKELIEAKKAGYEANVLFVIQMKGIVRFEPNYQTHKVFGETLKEAEKQGVNLLAMDCLVTEDGLLIDQAVEVVL